MISGVRRKFLGAKVSLKINFMGSAEGTTILGWSKSMPRKNFAKLHLKIRIFMHSEGKLVYDFTRLIRKMKS